MDEQVEMMLRGNQFKHLMENELGFLRRKYGLRRSEVEVLYFLSKCGENNTATDIRKHLSMTKGHVSQITCILCKKKYVSTYADLEDHRYIHYVPTGRAGEIIEDMSKACEEMYLKVFDGVSGEQLTLLADIASKVGNNIERLLEEG